MWLLFSGLSNTSGPAVNISAANVVYYIKFQVFGAFLTFIFLKLYHLPKQGLCNIFVVRMYELRLLRAVNWTSLWFFLKHFTFKIRIFTWPLNCLIWKLLTCVLQTVLCFRCTFLRQIRNWLCVGFVSETSFFKIRISLRWFCFWNFLLQNQDFFSVAFSIIKFLSVTVYCASFLWTFYLQIQNFYITSGFSILNFRIFT